MVRIKSLLKQEISRIIQQDFRQNLGLISITDINIAKDLATATVYYSHFGTEKEQRKSQEKLNKAKHFFQKQLNHHIRLKRIPILTFRRINHLEKGSEILTKINKLTHESQNP